MKPLKNMLMAVMLLSATQASAKDSDKSKAVKEVEQAETRMFQHMKYSTAAEYFKTDVADDFFTINADGVWADKQQSLQDTARLRMFEMASVKVVERKVDVYGDVGITNGKAQAFVNDMMVAEFLYTTVFVRKNGKWMYTRWQGTLSKDSPPMQPAPRQ